MGKSEEPIVVTGIGAVTPIGTGTDALWRGALSGRSAVDQITHFDAKPFATRIAAEVRDFDPCAYLGSREARRLDRHSQFAIAATRLALQDASLDPGQTRPERVGVCLGTAIGGLSFVEQEHLAFIRKEPYAASPLLAQSMLVGVGASSIAMAFGFTGPLTANGDSCASAPIALGNALHYLRRGEADVMIAGGSEAPLSELSFGAFAQIRAMSTRNDDPATASRPFDRGRDGFVMAEGAALLVLETQRRAESRGVRIYAEIGGYSLTNDGSHIAAPRPDGQCAARAMTTAIGRAGLSLDEIAAISAHGSSTPLNDKTETLAIKAAFGDELARRIPVFATKGLHGHALGATGAFEMALCCLALQHRRIPGSINLIEPDPECDLDYVADGPRELAPGAILSNSFGFGGINSCVVFIPAI